MILDECFLLEKEINGVKETIEDGNHPMPLIFIDDESGTFFTYYIKWENDVVEEYEKMIMNIFNIFCKKNSIFAKKVSMIRVVLIPQGQPAEIYGCQPQHDYVHNIFVYFVNQSDSWININHNKIMSKSGLGISFNGKEEYSYSSPKNQTCSILIEIAYSV